LQNCGLVKKCCIEVRFDLGYSNIKDIYEKKMSFARNLVAEIDFLVL
jgi:hypothetical protein